MMSVVTIKIYSFECDWQRCAEQIEIGDCDRVKEALVALQENGWLVFAGRQFCPLHAADAR